MKNKSTLLLTALLLALSLTACGGGTDRGQTNGQNGSTTAGDQNTAQDNGGVNSQNGAANDQNGALNDRNDSVITGENGSNSGSGTGDNLVEDAKDALTGKGNLTEDAMNGSAVRQSHQGADVDQMVRNARVHDRDGDLTDFENSVTPGSTRF